jgi:hypothetical protein
MSAIEKAKRIYHQKRRQLNDKWHEPEDIVLNGVTKMVSCFVISLLFFILNAKGVVAIILMPRDTTF